MSTPAKVSSLPPDLAVEIQSPSQSPADLDKKLQQYLAVGTHTVWVIYLRRKLARIFRGPDHVEEITADGFLEAPEILPGIRIALRQILEPEGSSGTIS